MHDAPKQHIDATGLRLGLVTSLYHEEVTARLRSAAINAFVEAGGDEDDLYEVVAPGTFELVPLVDALARKDIDGVVALGCVIRGETMHADYICRSVSQLLAHIAFEHEMAIGFGVLTCLSLEQAMERAGGLQGNKGEEAMNAVIATAMSMQAIEADLPDADTGEEDDDDDEEEVEYEYVEDDEGLEDESQGEYEYEEEGA